MRVPKGLDAPQSNFSKSFCPNFYSDTLCRKSNKSHDKKKKGGRIKSKSTEVPISSKPTIKFSDNAVDHSSVSSFKDDDLSVSHIEDAYEEVKDPDVVFSTDHFNSPFLQYWNNSLTPLFQATRNSTLPVDDIADSKTVINHARKISLMRHEKKKYTNNSLFNDKMHFTTEIIVENDPAGIAIKYFDILF